MSTDNCLLLTVLTPILLATIRIEHSHSKKMSSVPPIAIPPGFEQLSKEEQILYVEQLWNIIAAVPEEVPTPQWHIDLVRERRNSHNPEQVRSWDEVRQQLLSKYRDS